MEKLIAVLRLTEATSVIVGNINKHIRVLAYTYLVTNRRECTYSWISCASTFLRCETPTLFQTAGVVCANLGATFIYRLIADFSWVQLQIFIGFTFRQTFALKTFSNGCASSFEKINKSISFRSCHRFVLFHIYCIFITLFLFLSYIAEFRVCGSVNFESRLYIIWKYHCLSKQTSLNVGVLICKRRNCQCVLHMLCV